MCTTSKLIRWMYVLVIVGIFSFQIGIAEALVTWSQLGLDIDGGKENPASGLSVSLSSDGTIVAIGSASHDENGSSLAGRVRVYKLKSKNQWLQVGQDIDGEARYDDSGFSVSLSGDGTMVAIGAPSNFGNGVEYTGHVRVYRFGRYSLQWKRIGGDIDGEAEGDNSGYSVALSSDGTTVAIGARFNAGNGACAGHVRVYKLNSARPKRWVQVGVDIDGEAEGDRSGSSVSLSSDGTTVAIGAPLNDGKGHVRVYKLNAAGPKQWVQVGMDIGGEAEGDWSGYSVALSSDGTTVAIGALFPLIGKGHVRVYKLNAAGPNQWVQVGMDIDGEAESDWSGYSVALSSDGTTVAMGAPNNGGINDYAGHVRVYKLNSARPKQWVQVGMDIDGEGEGDWSGWSVSLSSDGTTVAVGAPSNDGNGENAGHVRVYKLLSST